jgi:hypothetical protein
MKYLVLFDEDEVMPGCMTNDPKKYWKGKYEIFEVKEDGTFVLIKAWGVTEDEGMAVYKWVAEDDPMTNDPEVMGKWNGRGRNDFSLQDVSIIKVLAHFKEPAEDILADIKSCGEHGEEIDGYWVVFGEYMDDNYSSGY